jgi:hypothetical protein
MSPLFGFKYFACLVFPCSHGGSKTQELEKPLPLLKQYPAGKMGLLFRVAGREFAGIRQSGEYRTDFHRFDL